MKALAYPAECTTPVDRAEADWTAQHYLFSADLRARGHELNVEEFDGCFTVFTSAPPPPPAPPGTPPALPELGGGVSIIDKETGHVSFWPFRPPSMIAQGYARAKADNGLDYQPAWPQA